MEGFGFVAFLDVLGVSRYSIEQAKQFLQKRDAIMDYAEQRLSKKNLLETSYLNENEDPPGVRTFADTILFYWPIEKREPHIADFARVANWLSEIIYCGLSEKLLIRGALSIGKYVYDSHTFIGPAVSGAHSWSEEADWFGVTLTPSCQFLLISYIERASIVPEFSHIDFREFFVEYPVPLKNGKTMDLWVVSWPYEIWEKAIEKGITPLGFMSSSLWDMPIPKGTESKYFNSFKFFRWYGKEVYPEVEESVKRTKAALDHTE